MYDNLECPKCIGYKLEISKISRESQEEKQDLLRACKALLVMMERGGKPRKLDDALSWIENDLMAQNMARAAIARAEGKR